MPESKKRFPWRLVICAAVLVPLAAVLGLIETVGRQGTIVGRSDRLELGMPETEAQTILGRADEEISKPEYPYRSIWHEGPADLEIKWLTSSIMHEHYLLEVSYRVARRGHPLWHLRRCAEKAYIAIHGPRR